MNYQIKIGDTLTFGNTKYEARQGGHIICVSERIMKKSEIISAIEKVYGYSLGEIKRRDRQRDIADARKALCYYLMRYSYLTSIAVAKTLHRDHATVLHHNQDWLNLIVSDKSVGAIDSRIREILFLDRP